MKNSTGKYRVISHEIITLTGLAGSKKDSGWAIVDESGKVHYVSKDKKYLEYMADKFNKVNKGDK